jgi:hypothetical protein
MSFRGPFNPEISPDGRRVAYTYYWQYTGYDPYCNVTNDCTVKRLYHGTAFTDPNRLTAWDEPGFLRRSGWIDAAWVDNSTVLLANPYIQPNEDTVLWSPDDKDSLKRWFEDHEYSGDVEDASISRDKSALATVTASRSRMSISSTVNGFFPKYPTRCFEAKVDVDGAKLSSPTFNANGSRLYWADSADGIHAVTLPRFGADACGTLTDGGKLLVAGATNPSWGPADVPPARPVSPPPGPDTGNDQGQDQGQGGQGQTPDAPPAAKAKLAVSKAKLAAALKKGLKLKLTGARAGKHAVTAKYGKTTVAKGTVTVSNGSGKATLRFTTTGKRKLKGRKKAALTITGAGARATVTLKR